MCGVGHHWTGRVCVVLVTFNSADVIQKSLKSLPQGVEVIVVDNASRDGSVALTKEMGVHCICNQENLGFGKASNIGAALSDREFILFLNPDAILHEGALETMMATALRYPDAGAIAPRLIDASGHSIWRYSSVLHPLPHGIRPPVEPEGVCCMPLLSGAALLCSRAAFEEVGGFDENIFLYHEDDDLCLKLTTARWSLINEPDAVVFHASGQSSRQSSYLTRFKSEQRTLSRAYVSQKYGLAFDPRREMRKSIKRLLIALATFDFKRCSAALGRLDALRHIDRFDSRKNAIAAGVTTQREAGLMETPAVNSAERTSL